MMYRRSMNVPITASECNRYEVHHRRKEVSTKSSSLHICDLIAKRKKLSFI